MVKLVIFDNDGVLVDSEPLGNQALVETMNAQGIPLTLAWAYEHTVGRRPPDIFEMILRDYNLTPSNDWEKLYEIASLQFFQSLKSIEGAAHTLKILNLRGIPYAIATSSTAVKTRMKYQVTGLDALITPNLITTGEEVSHGKPAPDIFLLAAEKMAANPVECLVVEDSIAGVTGAVAAGMQVLGFIGGSHIPYCENHAENLKRAGAHHIIASLSQIEGYLA